MRRRLRFAAATSLLGASVWLLQSGCSKNPPLICAHRVAAPCAGCALTWSDADIKAAFCQAPPTGAPTLLDCGGYHVVSVITATGVEVARSYYYDMSSGNLVAIIVENAPNRVSPMPTLSCEAGPADGFMLPSCPGAGSETLPQCTDGGDAGAPADGDGAAAD
jgi:hypothetical protein